MQSYNSTNYKLIRVLRAMFGLFGGFKITQIIKHPKWVMAFGFLIASSVYAQTGNFSYGFEVAPGANDWSENIQTASGAITAASGGFYGQEPQDSGNFTRFGGYNSIFPCNGYKTSIKIYLDVAGGYSNDTRADYSVAANGSDGNHERDFIFSIGFYDDAVAPGAGNRFVVSASNNSLGNPKGGLSPTVIATTSGWYRFEHSFENNAGVLQVVMKVYDSGNNVVGTWTLSNPADLIPSVVGGNRYGWMVVNQFPFLAIDDIELTLNPGNLPTASTDFETFSTGTVNYQGPGCVATVPAGGGGTYSVPNPYGSLWTVTDEWGTAPSSFDQEVKDDGTGNMVWRVSNAVTTGGFSNLPNSPSSALVAGESTAALYNDRGNNHTSPLNPPNPRASATTSNFHSGFRFKSSTGAAQTGLFLSVNPTPRQSAIRMTYVGIEDVGTGFDLIFYETTPGGNFPFTTIATNLSYTDWHQLDIYIDFVDGLAAGGAGNDVVVIELNGTVIHSGTTWESYYAENPVPFPNAPYAVDALMFRLAGAAALGTSGNGFYIDDVTYDNIAPPPGPVKLYTDNSLTTLISSHYTIQGAVDAASAGNAIDVPAGTYPETITVNKDLTIQGPNVGTAGNGVRAAEAIISDGKISIPGANTVVIDGFKIYQTNAITPISLGGGAVATIQNNIIERFGSTTGDPIRGVEISAGAGAKTIANNLFTGDISGGVFGGHKTWNSGIYLNAAGSTLSITGNTFEICRTALNIDDMNVGVSISGNTFTSCGTYMAYGGTVATTGSYTLGANEYGSAVSALVNLSNVNVSFRLDITAGTYDGTAFSALPLATLWQVESQMFHRTRSGRLGLVYYVANNQYVLSAVNFNIQTAIDYAVAGDVINIQNGSYNQRLVVSKSLTLAGESEAGCIIEGSGAGVTGNGSGIFINNGITNVTIQDLTVQNFTGSGPNSNAGIYAIGGNDDLEVQHVTLKDNVGGSGFYANGPIDNVLLNNLDVSGHTNVAGAARGIVIWNGLKSNITITNSDVYNNNCCGIELQDGTSTGVTMTGNNVYDNGDNGFGLTGMEGPGENVISGNTVTNNGRFGIEIKNPNGSGLATGAGRIVVENNNVSRNVAIADLRDIAGIAVFRRAVLAGNVDVPNGVVVQSNTVSGYVQGSTSDGFGIVIEGTNSSALNNSINGNDVGLQLQSGHLPYPGDGNQNNVADDYFGRGNSPITCGITVSGNTFSGNGVNERNVPASLASAGAVVNTNTNITYCSIQAAIDDPLTLAGHTITVGAGTYLEDVQVHKANLSLIGAGIDQSIIDHSGQSGYNNSGVNITANGVTMKGFTVIDNDGGSVPRYGLKVGTSSVTTDDVTLDSVKVTQSFRTGFDLARPKNITLKNVFAISNGGAGVFMSNPEGASIESITTSGNPWTGVSISSRSDWPGDATGVVFTGTNSFGENGGKNGGVQIESDNTLPISWGNNIADGKDVTIQQGELAYALSGPTTNVFGSIVYAPYFRFYQNLPQAQSAAGIGPDHVDKPRYIQDANCSTVPDTTNFYVFDYVDAATTIQAAIDAAVDGNTVNVDAGTFQENVNVNKVLTVIGVDTTQTIIQGSGGNVITMAAGSSATNRTTLSQVRVTGGASGIVPSSNNTLNNVLSTGNTSYGVNLGNLNDLMITNSCFTHNNVGLKIPSTATVTNLMIDGSEFSYNTQHGWYSDANSGVEPDLDTVSITNTAFNYNGIKGIYTERLSNALLQNVTVQSSGIAANTFASGIDINLKWKDYENIEFDMVTVSGSGTGGSSGSGVTIKGRNDGSTYGANPASLNNLVFTNNNFASPGIVGVDTLTGVAVGNAITNISFNGTNNFTGTGNGFTNYIDGAAMAPFSLGTSSFDGGLAYYIRNLSVVDIEALSTTFDGKIGNDMSIAERTSTEDRMLHKPDTSVLGLILYFDNCADGSCDGCYTAERFNGSVSTGPSQAPGLWYTDRYAPDSFYVALDSTLVHLIDAADGTNNRPGSFSSAFYNTQGRKYDLEAGITMLSIDLYVPSAWATTGNRMAGVWGTGYDAGNSISAYPIIEFVSDNGDPRFRGYEGDGSWIDMGLPCNFAYDSWHTLRIELLPTGEFRYSVDDLRISTNLHGVNGTVELQNIILQGHNSTTGETYQITWDNFINGNGPEINNDVTGPDPIAIGSGLTNQHMAVGEYCGLSASVKAHKRFLGDVTPVNGNTYQFGTGVSPTDGSNTTPDPGTARWNYLVSVNLGTFTFNDLNVYLDIDFDNSDSACQVGPYTADLSTFMIANSMGGNSVFQGSENLGFNFWQTLGDPSILPFDPYAEGTYDLAVRIENKDGVELMHVPIIVEVGCEFVEPADDLEPPMLVCPADTTIDVNVVTDPWYTGIATATGTCPVNITYGDNSSGLTGCNGTGVLIRTWYNTDSTQTCDQTITIVDEMAPQLDACPADIVAAAFDNSCAASVTFDGPSAIDVEYFEGFENPAFESDNSGAIAYQGWNDYNSALTRVPTGTDGVTSGNGSAHGVIDTTGSNGQTGVFTRLGGYSSTFGSGFSTSQDIYIDLNDPAVIANTYGFDVSTAANSQSNSHRRDFVFHAASNASGNVLIGGSNNSSFTRKTTIASGNHYEITTSGWYTFEWVFRDSAGSLAVDLNLMDAGGNHLFTETRYTVADDIATIVGGNRYMWFTFIEAARLHIDNTSLQREYEVACSASSGDVFNLGTTTVSCTVADSCGNADSCSFNITVKSYILEPFNDSIMTSATQQAGAWYTDRYAPDSFYVDANDSNLVHLIDASDGATSRPGSFSSAFYNTQGRKYDLDSNVSLLSIDLYVPSGWATTGNRMAGVWGTGFDAGNSISAYPIIEFVSDNGDPRFRGYEGDGSWIDMGLPCDFAYDAWHTLRIELLPNGEFRYSVDDLRISTNLHGVNGTVEILNIILQGHNSVAGETYEIRWDNFVHGNGPDINYDVTGPDPIAIGSGLSNQHMAVAELCGVNASIKAHKRFLGDVTPVMGDVAGDTYQFGTGVSPTDGSNTTPDPGTARWNYLVSVNLGAFTFNDLNVYLDIDFDNSDSACGVGPYVADLSAFMIANSMGGSSVFQGSENLGFNFWQTIGDPSILPFDPYAEGTYDLAVRIVNKEGVELMHVPIIVEVGCEFVDPSEDLEPATLVCVPDTSIETGQSADPANTGMATVTGICTQNLTYGDDESGLTGCNGTGTIVRTWYNQDSTQTCTQTITVVDTTAPLLSACPADTVLFATGPAGASLVFDAPTATEGFFEGFENAVPPAEAWLAFYTNVARVPTGTAGIASKTGGYHATLDPADSAQTGAFTRLGGYSSNFGNGFTASQDIYIDLTDSNVANNTYGFDISTAVNNQANSHRRDFIFHAASNASGNVLIAGSNNTNFTRRNDLGSLNNYEITSSGWYTFEWVFRDSAGSLAVDLNLKDAGGNHLFTETRYTVADDIATIVGGNRYMWFTFLETSDLRIDNTSLNRSASVVCSDTSGTTFPYGITTVTCVTADACGNADSCSFNVTVVDTAGALNFDGANDVVAVPHDASLSGYGKAVTVEAWIRPEKVTGRQGIVGKWNDLSGTNRRSMLLWATDDDVQFYVSSTGSNFPSALATNKLTVGQWTHVAGTFDGQSIRLYIDGVLSASTPFNGTLFNNTVDPLLIGAVDGGGSGRKHFDGDIDEVRVYNRVLCAAEIQANMKCELSGSEAGLQAYYNFNQGIAGADNTGVDTLIDSSPNSNTGDLQNFALNGFASNWTLQADSVNGFCTPYLSPELIVYGNSQVIMDGDISAGVSDSTDFGTVTVGEFNANCFYMVNTGTDVLNISSVSVSGGDAAQFAVSAYGSGVVNPGDSAQVCVTYSPLAAGPHTTTVEVVSDYCVATTYDFAIIGEGYEQTCDTIRFISDTTWRMSTTITPSNFSGNWSGVNGVLPASSTFTSPVMIGQPYNFSYQTLFAVDSAEIIKSGNNITYYRKTIMLDTLVDVGANLRATFDDQVEIYVNGKLLAGHYNFSNQNSKLPPFDVMFSGDGSVVNGYGGNKAFGFTTADTLENVFQPGVNDVVVVLRNLATSHDAGGFSLSMQVDGCEGVLEPDTTTPVDAVCDTVGIIASAKWKMSTTVTPSTFNGSWSGVNGTLPDTSTFTQPVVIGQPFSYQTIFPVDSSSVIRAENNIRYFHRTITLDSLVDIGALLKATFDDQMEVYVNGTLLGGHYGFSNQNSKLPPFEATYVNGGGVNNGTSGNKPFDYTAPDTLDNVFKPGINDVIVVLRNRANTGELGGFSINLVVNGCEGDVEIDTNVVPEDTLTTSIVSDNGWEKSTQTEASNLSGNWSGASALPPTHTYTLPAVEGQPYGYVTIDPIDSAKVIKTENNITFFRRTFELTDNVGLDARFRSNVDDGLEIYINGKLVTRDEDFGTINFRNPNHDLKFFGGTSPVNGFSGGDLYNFVTAGNLDTFFVTGTNEVVVAVRNKSKSTDMGGFSFRMDIDKGGSKVIVKTADATSGTVTESSILDFDLYPNPTTGLVNVVILGKLLSDDNEIIVQDVSGKVITRGSFESFAGDGGMQIDMSEYASGVYLIRVKSGDTYRAKRVMKN